MVLSRSVARLAGLDSSRTDNRCRPASWDSRNSPCGAIPRHPVTTSARLLPGEGPSCLIKVKKDGHTGKEAAGQPAEDQLADTGTAIAADDEEIVTHTRSDVEEDVSFVDAFPNGICCVGSDLWRQVQPDCARPRSTLEVLGGDASIRTSMSLIRIASTSLQRPRVFRSSYFGNGALNSVRCS